MVAELLLEFANGILSNYVRERVAWIGYHESYAIAGIFSLVFFCISRFIMKRIVRNPITDWRFAAEGIWLQSTVHSMNADTHEDAIVSIMEIKCHRLTEEFEITGRTFRAANMSLRASWESMYVGFPERKVLHFLYKAKVQGEHPPDVVGSARIAFMLEPRRNFRFIYAEGCFQDPSTESRETIFRMRRATKSEIKRLFPSDTWMGGSLDTIHAKLDRTSSTQSFSE